MTVQKLINGLKMSVALSALMVGGAAYGAETAPKSETTKSQDEKKKIFRHNHHDIEEIEVKSSIIGTQVGQSLQNITVLTGEQLNRSISPTLGDALDNLPGISQTAFGPAASRPIIRGLGGDRIRVLVNGIGTIDVSTTSPDHAIAVEMANAERIEVIRGPATLAYGNNAVGGVINIFDGRIPTAEPEGGLKGSLQGLYGTNADEVMFAGGATASLGGGFVAHASGFWRDTGDIDVPGFVESAGLRAFEEMEEHDDEHGDEHDDEHGHEEEGEDRGTVEGSAQRNFGFKGGISRVFDRGFFGVSVSYFDNLYGIPGGHGHGHGHDEEEGEEHEGEEHDEHDEEEENIMIDIEQIRIDLAGEYRMDGFIEVARFNASYADFDQLELEGDEIGTTFANEGFEARLELVHGNVGPFSGAVGVQYRDRDFSAVGEEAFVVPNTQQQYGIFAIERASYGSWDLEAGARIEYQENETEDGRSRDFTNFSGSVGLTYNIAEGWQATVGGFYTQRAPNPEELFSNGEHLAVQTFEIGNIDLDKEVARTIEAGISKTDGDLTFGLNAYYTSYNDYIAELFTGRFRDELPIARFRNEDAEFYGFEFAGVYEIFNDGATDIDFTFGADYVRATLTDFDADVPFIAPLSIRAGLSYFTKYVDFIIEADWNDSQNNIFSDDIVVFGDEPLLEFETGSFVDVTATLNVHPWEDIDANFYVQGRNLFDEDIRYASSRLRDLVPAPGIDVRFGFRLGF